MSLFVILGVFHLEERSNLWETSPNLLSNAHWKIIFCLELGKAEVVLWNSNVILLRNLFKTKWRRFSIIVTSANPKCIFTDSSPNKKAFICWRLVNPIRFTVTPRFWTDNIPTVDWLWTASCKNTWVTIVIECVTWVIVSYTWAICHWDYSFLSIIRNGGNRWSKDGDEFHISWLF